MRMSVPRGRGKGSKPNRNWVMDAVADLALEACEGLAGGRVRNGGFEFVEDDVDSIELADGHDLRRDCSNLHLKVRIRQHQRSPRGKNNV